MEQQQPPQPQPPIWLGTRQQLASHGTGMFRHFIEGIELVRLPGALGLGLRTRLPIAKGTLVWEADVEQQITKVLTEQQVLALPSGLRDAWLEYAWSLSNGWFVGPRLDLPLERAKMLDASCFLNHSGHPALGFSGDYHLVALRDVAAGEDITLDYAMSEWRIFGAVEFEDLSHPAHKHKHEHKKGKQEAGARPSAVVKHNVPGGELEPDRRFVTVDDYKRPELQAKYQGHFLSSVQRLIDLHQFKLGEGGYRELNPAIELRDHPIKFIGKGLFAAKPMKKGDVVWRENGVTGVYRTLEDVRSAPEQLRNFYLHYGYQTDDDEFSTPPSLEWLQQLNDVSSYMNHSCDPNIEIIDYNMWVARRDVKVDEELCYDYAMSEVSFDRLPQCACGTALCRGKVTKDDYLLPELRRRYLMSWSSHVLERLRKEPTFLGVNDLRVPLVRAEWAHMVKATLVVDTELREDLVQRQYDVQGSVFVAHFRASNPRMLRTSVTSFWDMFLLAIRTLAEFQPPQ